MSIDIIDLDLLPTQDIPVTSDLVDQGLARCWVTCDESCYITCLFTSW